MTDRDTLPPDDEADALAAEYVLGVLAMDERMAVEARLRNDATFAARVAAWEARLSGMNDEFPELPPPDLLPRIEARLFPVAPRRRVGWGWLGGLALAGSVAVAILVGRPAEPVLRATLTAPETALIFEAEVARDGMLTLARVAGAEAEPGRDYQLWAIGAAGVPKPLGLVEGAEVTLAAAVAAGETLAVSLEPDGGSTTGAPTGPVLVTGVLTDG